jgi:hypothetical protein
MSTSKGKGKQPAGTAGTVERGDINTGMKVTPNTEPNSDSDEEPIDKVDRKIDYLKDKINTLIKGITDKVGSTPKDTLAIV